MTDTAQQPDTIRTDDGIGRTPHAPHASVDDLGNPSRITRDLGGPDDRRDPDFGSYGSGAQSNSPLF